MPIEFLLSRRRLQDVQFLNEDSVLWVEVEDGEGGLYVDGGKQAPLLLSIGNSVKGGVFYGGGEFHARNGKIVFCSNCEQLIALDMLTNMMQPITPAFGRVASPCISPDGKWVIYVHSDGENDQLNIVPIDGCVSPRKLISGADFYVSPGWHPTGEWLTWVEWNHPCMPWQGSRVKLGRLQGEPLRLIDEISIAGEKNQSAHQPLFSPDGKWLSYLQQQGDWEDLVLYDLTTKESHIAIKGDGFMLSTPDWVQGLRTYGWGHDSTTLYYFRYQHAQTTLWKMNIYTGESRQIPTTPYTWLSQLACSSSSETLLFLASSPLKPKQVTLIKDEELKTMRICQEDDSTQLTSPQQIVWKGLDGSDVFGLLFLPQLNPKERCPLLIEIHGGPTMQRSCSFAAEPTFFTSRGMAYLQVNYRGSTGYGTSYRDALRGRWGELEVADIYSAARFLIDESIVDGERMALIGSSSGGTSVLNTLRRYPGVFRCAICSYAIGDLIADAKQTHKFERFYHQYLIGDLANHLEDFKERSPLFHVDEICDPLLLFHGSEDKVVNPAQSQALYDSLTSRGVDCTLKVFENEGHGFRRIETLKIYYEMVLDFLERYLL